MASDVTFSSNNSKTKGMNNSSTGKKLCLNPKLSETTSGGSFDLAAEDTSGLDSLNSEKSASHAGAEDHGPDGDTNAPRFSPLKDCPFNSKRSGTADVEE